MLLGSILHSPWEHSTNGQRRQLFLLNYLASWVADQLPDVHMVSALAAMQ